MKLSFFLILETLNFSPYTNWVGMALILFPKKTPFWSSITYIFGLITELSLKLAFVNTPDKKPWSVMCNSKSDKKQTTCLHWFLD